MADEGEWELGEVAGSRYHWNAWSVDLRWVPADEGERRSFRVAISFEQAEWLELDDEDQVGGYVRRTAASAENAQALLALDAGERTGLDPGRDDACFSLEAKRTG